MITPVKKAQEKTAEKPWYRQFWPWFIIALPASSVIAGLGLVFVAVKDQDSLVRDDWYKDGKSINVDMARDTRATALGLSADIRIDAVTGEVHVNLHQKTGVTLPDTLTLGFFHVTLARLDQTLLLKKQGSGSYRGALSQALHGEFDLELAGDNWRLTTESTFPREQLHLEPR